MPARSTLAYAVQGPGRLAGETNGHRKQGRTLDDIDHCSDEELYAAMRYFERLLGPEMSALQFGKPAGWDWAPSLDVSEILGGISGGAQVREVLALREPCSYTGPRVFWRTAAGNLSMIAQIPMGRVIFSRAFRPARLSTMTFA
jgi:hypothetical protein